MRVALIGGITGALLVERLAAWVLHTVVGSALLATGPEVLLAAVLGLICVGIRLVVLGAVPVGLALMLPPLRISGARARQRGPERVVDP